MADAELTLPDMIDSEAELIASVRAGEASLDAGRSVPYDQVRAWLLSWGAEEELPKPQCP